MCVNVGWPNDSFAKVTEQTAGAVPAMFEDGACHDVEPFQVFFTCGSISQGVRNGTRLDDTIETAMEGGLRLDRFPPAEPVRLSPTLPSRAKISVPAEGFKAVVQHLQSRAHSSRASSTRANGEKQTP